MDKPLRKGWTTGACAAGAARAAWAALVHGAFPDPVTVELPRGVATSFALARAETGQGWARAGIVKDAGDDPDVTHGALKSWSRWSPAPPDRGLVFRAGPGVGTVTCPACRWRRASPPSIPVRARRLSPTWRRSQAPVDARLTIAVPGGEELAAKT